MVLGLLSQLEIFSQLNLIELLGLLIGMGLLELWHLIYLGLLTGFGMLVFFTNWSLTEFQIRYFTLFLLFSVIDVFNWFSMRSAHKNIRLRLEILDSSFLVLHFSHYTFLIMLPVIFLSILMIPLSILSVIRHPICGNNLNWLLKLNLIYNTLWNGARSGLMVSMLRKLNWFCLTGLDGSLLEEKSSFQMLELTFSSNWIIALTSSLLLKLPPRKLKPWFVLQSFLLLRLLSISINLPYSYIWNTAVITDVYSDVYISTVSSLTQLDSRILCQYDPLTLILEEELTQY